MAAPASRQLMERAGTVLAEAAYRFAGPMPALLLCGPGNNGGDGYVAARAACPSRRRGSDRRDWRAASEAAKMGAVQWSGDVERLSDATAPAPLLIDCLFGTGLRRGIEDTVCEQLSRLVKSRSCGSPAIFRAGSRATAGRN